MPAYEMVEADIEDKVNRVDEKEKVATWDLALTDQEENVNDKKDIFNDQLLYDPCPVF